MESSVPVDNLLALGRKLVEELGLGDSNDTLGRWMAHHVADLIINAENTKGDGKNVAKHKCFEAILELWKHRSMLPNGKRPFEEMEPVLRAIQSLDPEHKKVRYYNSSRPNSEKVADSLEQEKWLNLADGLDYSAKLLIGYCLSQAASASLDKSQEWVKLAEGIEEDGSPEIAIRFFYDDKDNSDPNEEHRASLKDKIQKLHAFLSISNDLIDDLEDKLKALPTINSNTGSEL